MAQIDWKRKLTSRKLWLSLAAFIVGLVVYITNPDKTNPDAITGLVMSLGSVVGYVIGEGLADGGNKE